MNCLTLLLGTALAAAATCPPQAAAQAPLQNSTLQNSTLEQAQQLNLQAHTLERTDPSAALEAADRAAALLRAEPEGAAAAEAVLHRSHALRLLARYGEALAAGEEARRLAVVAEHERTEARAVANLAVLYEIGGLEAQALSLHRRALLLFERQAWPEAVASTLLNLGNLFHSRGELAEASAAHRRALRIKQETGAPGAGAALSNLAAVAFDRGRPAEAVQLLHEAVAAHQREDDMPGAAIAWRNLVEPLLALDRIGEAQQALRNAAELARGMENVLVHAAIEEARADLLSARAGTPPDRALMQDALAANDAAVQLASEAEPSRRVRLLRQRALLSERAGDYHAALAALRESESLAESDSKRSNERRYAVLSAYFDSERQRMRIAALRESASASAAELSRQRTLRNSLVMGAALLALVVALLYGRIRQRRRTEQALAAHNKRLQAALDAAERERGHAEEAERVNRELLRVAAEDLRVPLTSALGRAERLLMLAAEQTTLRRDAAAIADTLQHLVHLVNDLVESAELERQDARLARQPLDLAHLLRGVCAHYGLRAAEKRQQLDCEAPPQLDMVGDPARLREALEHLVGNALKFTPVGKRIHVSANGEDGVAVVRVRDQGPGLREDERERAFGKLQRASARPTGNEHTAGLGLWLVKRIAELHGGNVEANGGPGGEGSEFVLRLPMAG